MLRTIRRAALQVLRSGGMFRRVCDSRWRRDRLLILCYHAISQADEHLWRPALFMDPTIFVGRLDILKRGGYNVLPLGEGLERLRTADLPPRSVAITFDDGGHDFYSHAFPILKAYGFPVTVYQTTYYSAHPWPVFNLGCSYLLWKSRGVVHDKGRELGLDQPMDLRSEASRSFIVKNLVAKADAQNLSGAQKNELAGRLAQLLGINYGEIQAKRLLQLMTPQEIKQLASEGVDFQLHTHRHRTPLDEALFRKEIQDNRQSLRQVAGKNAVHFCYPSGIYRAEFLPWLKEENIISATTCDAGLAHRGSNPLLLPRFIDTSQRSEIEFESWLTGVGEMLALRKSRIVNAQARL